MSQADGSPPSGRADTGPSSLSRWFRPFFNLRWRLAFVYVALFGIFVTILCGLLYSSANALLYRDGKTAFPQRVSEMRTQFLHDLCQNEPLQTTDNFIVQQNTSNDIDVVYILNSSGQVISSSNRTLLKHQFPYIDPAFFTSFHPATNGPFQVPHPGGDSSDGLLLSLQTPTDCSSPPFNGYLAAITSYSTEHTTLSNLLTMIGVIAAIMIILGASIIFFLTGYMLRPLRDMATASQAIANGDLQQRVRLPQSNDEVGTLTMSFNQMADRIEHAFQAQQESERRTQRFVSDASHELRTPITSLRGFTEVLMRGAKDDPETTQRVLKLMKSEAERMTRLVNDLLTLARLDEGIPLRIQDVDLVDIAIEGVKQARKLAADDRKISLDLATQERLKVRGDSELLKQMLLILLDNAIKYGRPGEEGWIQLRMDRQNGSALIQVIDNGSGISPQDLPHLFDRFYRGQNAPTGNNAANSNKTSIAGTGLGLAIAQAIARAHHGNITAQSEPSKKTIFTITLPCEQ